MSNRQRVVLWVPVIVYMAGIFYVSSLSDVSLPGGMSDVSLHSIEYFGLAVVVVRAFAGGLPRRIDGRVAGTAMLVTLAYAASDELHQTVVAGRTAELKDVAADAAGALAGTVTCWAWGIISPVCGPHSGTSRDEL